jgi:LysM domain
MTILFTVEGGTELEFGFVPEFELTSHDLPKDLETGTKLRKTITRYAGTYASVQIHGTEYKPIELDGVFEDSWWGEDGHARDMVAQIEGIVALGEIVRLEYDELELWGTLEASFTEKDRHRIEYRITFEPFWREDPTKQIYIAFAEPPNDLGETLDARLATTEEFFKDAPDGIDANFVSAIILGLASARNKVSDVLGYITKVSDYADLTAQQVALVTRSLFAAARTLENASDSISNAGESTVDNTADAWIRGGEYIQDGARRINENTEDLVLMLRRFLEARRPRRQRTHIVRDGDTLQRLAKIYLGDFARWMEIADTNDLESSTLVTGAELLIPRR